MPKKNKNKNKRRKFVRFVGKITRKNGDVIYAWRDLGIRGIPIYE